MGGRAGRWGLASLVKRLLRPAYAGLFRCYGVVNRLTYPYLPLPPARVNVMVTSRCNEACSFCHVKDGLNRRERDKLTREEWDAIVRTIPRTTIIDVAGGEPFMAEHIDHILGRMLARRLWVCVITNGTRLDDARVEDLVERRLAVLQVSVHGLAGYYARRGQPRAFERKVQALETVAALRRRKRSVYPLTCLKVCVTDENADDVPGLLALAESLGVDQLQCNFMFATPLQTGYRLVDDLEHPLFAAGNGYTYGGGSAGREAVKRAVKHLLDRRGASEVDIAFTLGTLDIDEMCAYIDDPARFGVRTCDLPWGEFTLYHDGRLTPCVTYGVGNIRDLGYDVRRVLRQPRYTAFVRSYRRRMPFAAPCGGCHYRPQTRAPRVGSGE